MIITFYDKNLEIVGNVTQWKSLYYANTYNSMGAFTLELYGYKEALQRMWQYCTIDYDNDNVYVITSVNLVGITTVLTGFPATYIFSKRASTTVIKNKNAEQALKELVDDMTPWDNLTTGELKGLSDIFENQVSDRQILEYMQSIGQTTDVGFRVVKKDKELVFECYKPSVNNSVKYSTNLNNVVDLDYLLNDDNYYNVAIVAGAGEGENRIDVIATIGDFTGTERRELYIDARNEQPEEGETTESYEERLERLGLQKLAESLRIETLSFFVSNNDEVKLGDIISISLNDYGLILQSRVVEEEIINQNNTTERTISVGTPLNVRRI